MADALAKQIGSDTDSPASWLAQATAHYKRLSASLSELGSQLAALEVTMQTPDPYGLSSSSPNSDHAGEQTIAEGSTTPAIRVNLLGPFRLRIGERRIERGMHGQVKTVLEYLVSQGSRPTSREAVLDLLWPEIDPTVGSSRLRVVMHTLRKLVQYEEADCHRDLVLVSGNNFVLNPDAHLWVDVAEFERLWHSGWRLARAGHTQEAVTEYEQAEALYSGDYLEDEPYADWTLLRREALRDAYTGILTTLSNIALESQDYTGSIIWATKLLVQDNCREDAYRLLMASHQRLGQPARAAYWYSLCERTLQRELGIPPSMGTQELYRALSTR